MTSVDDVLAELRRMAKKAKPGYREGMARFGIVSDTALGVPLPELRRYAKALGKNHALAMRLWKAPVHEAKMLAAFLAEPEKLTERQMDRMVHDFYSWDVCDVCTGTMLDGVPFYGRKIREYVKSDREFVRRAGFVLMAAAAVHDKKAPDGQFLAYFPIIRRYSTDGRNFVRKAVNWALRQIGKRNVRLHREALALARELKGSDDRSARWIGTDAFRELSGINPARFMRGRRRPA